MPSSTDSADSAPVPTQGNAGKPKRIGPILFFRDCGDGDLQLAALLVCPERETPPAVTVGGKPLSPQLLHRRDGHTVFRYLFSLPAATGGSYRVENEQFDVAGIPDADLRLAYVSCNGQERGDRQRSPTERNVMWQRLARQHAAEPLNLLLQGGDQLYADEMLEVHPAVRVWADGTTADSANAPLSEGVEEELRTFLLKCYLELYSQPAPAWLLGRVPTLCMWDDHDICDGWGSISTERMNSPVGRAVFQAAREFFLLFQFGCSADDPPPVCPDRTGATLTWAAKLPGVLLVTPDLRSERQPNRIMGPAGWAALRDSLSAAGDDQVFLLSSVPVLGPRLSWIEAILHHIPGAQKYEDDLRDQWQSRSHREEWRQLLRELLAVHERGGSPLTILSGEIHLAARCEMAAHRRPLHQLIASGIAHPPPPKWYGRVLGGLALLGESPLPRHPIRLHPLPGRRRIYTTERNYLMLQRHGGRWLAWWELERSGRTPPLEL